MSHLSNFLKKMPQQEFKAGEIIFAKGQIAQELYIPVRGIVKVYEIDKLGIERRLLSVQKFEPFPSGWMAEPGRPIAYTYEAYTKVKCAVISPAAMKDLIDSHPKALVELLTYTDRRVEYAKQRIEMLVQGRAEDKVLYFLKYVYNRASKPSSKHGEVLITANMTQKEIGESLGLTRETTSRVLRDFEARGILKRGPKQQLFIVEAKLLSHL